jgi:hypothetical protein
MPDETPPPTLDDFDHQHLNKKKLVVAFVLGILAVLSAWLGLMNNG